VKVQAREAVGAVLLTGGSVCAGILLPAALAGLKALSPFESVVLADGFAAIAVGAWMLLVRGKNP